MLLELRHDVKDALCLSIHMEDFVSAKLLLAASYFPGDDPRGWAEVFRVMIKSGNPEMQDLVVGNLARRRQSLANLALQHLRQDELLKMGLYKEGALDSTAFTVYRILQKRGVNVPQNLVPTLVPILPGPIYLGGDDQHYSVYQLVCVYQLVRVDRFPCVASYKLEMFKSLFKNRFDSVEEHGGSGRSPLFLLSENVVRNHGIDDYPVLVHWLLDRGARPNFIRGFSFPNILFYIAMYYGLCVGGSMLFSKDQFNSLCQRVSKICDPLYSDGCRCYCSYNGCLPFQKIWRCDEGLAFHSNCTLYTQHARSQAVKDWCNLFRFDNTQAQTYYRAVCRRETFDRLGMAHTCCQFRYFGGRICMPEAEREELQEEDREHNQQLDLIMQAYDLSRQRYSGCSESFWDTWWRKLDEILPVLETEERCKVHCVPNVYYDEYRQSDIYSETEAEWHERRVRVEQEALAKLGYVGLDFIDVIKLHFADVLDPNASEPSQKLRISSMSLMGHPRGRRKSV